LRQPVSPYINRFLQPDSIIPDPANPQNWNRYGYVVNNPINNTDPSGHVTCEGKNYDDGPNCLKNPNSQLSIEVAIAKYQKECRKGKNEACPGGTAGLVAFGASAIVTAGVLDYALTSGALTDLAFSAVQRAYDKILYTCLLSDVCRRLVGAGGGSSPETFVRYMVNAELDDIRANDGILRGANALNGPTYFTNQYYRTVYSAQQTLSLRTPPEIGVEFQIINNSQVYGPTVAEKIPGLTSGGGIQYWSFDQVQVTITKIWELIK
jgi:hypothetical protein